MQLLAASAGDVANYALAVFLVAVGAGLAYTFVRLGGTFARLSSFIKGTERELLPVIHKVGESVDKVNGQLDKVDRVTDSAVDMADSADTAVRAVSMAIARPVQKISGLAAGHHTRCGDAQGAPRLARGGPNRQGGCSQARARSRGRAPCGRRRYALDATSSRSQFPRERPFAAVVGLVVGGIAARHEVTLDVLDDLQLALDGVLERTDDDHEVS